MYKKKVSRSLVCCWSKTVFFSFHFFLPETFFVCSINTFKQVRLCISSLLLWMKCFVCFYMVFILVSFSSLIMRRKCFLNGNLMNNNLGISICKLDPNCWLTKLSLSTFWHLNHQQNKTKQCLVACYLHAIDQLIN